MASDGQVRRQGWNPLASWHQGIIHRPMQGRQSITSLDSSFLPVVSTSEKERHPTVVREDNKSTRSAPTLPHLATGQRGGERQKSLPALMVVSPGRSCTAGTDWRGRNSCESKMQDSVNPVPHLMLSPTLRASNPSEQKYPRSLLRINITTNVPLNDELIMVIMRLIELTGFVGYLTFEKLTKSCDPDKRSGE